jgi:CPA2 family monovalent cation:H+ antiporter-2
VTPTTHDLVHLLIELGLVVIGLAILARLASRWSFSAIPFYLLAGLAFGNGGLAPLNVSATFIDVGAKIGLLLLLFMLGLEYSGTELLESLRSALPAAAVDFVLNFSPGLIAGFLLHWSLSIAVLLGGVTYVSSSGVIAKLLADSQQTHNPETPTILSILVLEDLAMAMFLPVVAVLLEGGGAAKMTVSVFLAIAAVSSVLFIAVRYGQRLSDLVAHESDEIVLLTILGAMLLVAGISERLGISAGIGAFLVGIAVSSPMAERTRRLLAPLRDLFAATFFFFFGLQIHPSSLPPVLLSVAWLVGATVSTKVLTGYWSARRAGVNRRGSIRAGMALVAHGEFSIVIAGLGAGIEPRLEPLSAAFVLIMAIIGPILARIAGNSRWKS